MSSSHRSPQSPPTQRSMGTNTELPSLTAGVDESAAPFEWSDFLDFTFDEQLYLSLEDSITHSAQPLSEPPLPSSSFPPPQPQLSPGEIAEQFGVGPTASKRVGSSSDRVRKRDPRMVCSNFLAGVVPCACPEMDAKLEEEADKGEGASVKKKVRMGRGGKARCQVPGCGADISELKGYHRRHRVCLRCANASSVMIDENSKRYCQQCGKFHVLSDFDEGKRSCRRKLERHNNRRRRKSNDPKEAVDKEPQVDTVGEDVSSDGEAGLGICSESLNTETDLVHDPKDGNISHFHLAPDPQNTRSDSGVTSTPSDDIQVNRLKEDSKNALSPSYCDNKSAYSSMCPTGRISFKLYDWNPAKFPRRLRLQIFQWLASMPVELEGYIRPGCTILTAFISMPHFMWNKLFEDPTAYVNDFIAPGKVLSGRGTAFVYLNDMIFRVLRDETSVVKIKMDVRTPQLHYVNPICFEAGKPMEFVACGSNIFQPKFRSLVSFAGKYLDHDYYVAFPHNKPEGEAPASFDHQFCRIHVPSTEPNFFGPAFVEIENECGLSNFIPIIIGDEQVCSEIKTLQQKYDVQSDNIMHLGSSGSLNSSVRSMRGLVLSDVVLDVAWLLKQPAAEKMQQAMTSTQIRRLSCLLDYLLRNQCFHILQRVLVSLESMADGTDNDNTYVAVSSADWIILLEYVKKARDYLCHKGYTQSSHLDGAVSVVRIQEMNTRPEGSLIVSECSASLQTEETAPLISDDVAMDVIDIKQWSRKSCNNVILSKRSLKSRPLIFMVAALAVCFAICTVLLHPYQVRRIAVHIRRCLFDNKNGG